MAAHLLKDKTGKSWYDDEPFKVNFFDGYNGFLSYLSELGREFIVNVYTLNHDLLFESFNNTGLSMETYLMVLMNMDRIIMES